MFSAPVRKNVFLEDRDEFSQQFNSWAQSSLSGNFKLVKSNNPLKLEIEFGNEEDLTVYLLTWTEPLTYPRRVMPKCIVNEFDGFKLTAPITQINQMRSGGSNI